MSSRVQSAWRVDPASVSGDNHDRIAISAEQLEKTFGTGDVQVRAVRGIDLHVAGIGCVRRCGSRRHLAAVSDETERPGRLDRLAGREQKVGVLRDALRELVRAFGTDIRCTCRQAKMRGVPHAARIRFCLPSRMEHHVGTGPGAEGDR